MNNKLWCLTEGEYSDYHIVGIFSSLEKIEEFKQRDKEVFIKKQRKWRETDPIEDILDYYDRNFNDPFEIIPDILVVDNELFPYRVHFKENGDITYLDLEDNFDYMIHNKQYIVFSERYGKRTEITLQIFCNARDKEHAIKIASDKRRELKSLNII